MEIKNVKEGDILCKREYNYWNKNYNWEFQEVKKITPTGKIRLMNGKLIDSLGVYNVYNKEMKQIFAKDSIRDAFSSIIYIIYSNKNNIAEQVQLEDIFKFIDTLEGFQLDTLVEWGKETDRKYYKDRLDTIKKYKKEIM